MRKIKLNVKVVAAFIVGAALAGSIATAAITPTTGTLKACADNRTQALFLSTTGTCSSSRTLVEIGGNGMNTKAISSLVTPSVVSISVTASSGSGTGSGSIYKSNSSSSYIITNNHVIESAITSGTITVEFADGSVTPATIVGRDRMYDVAVLLVKKGNLPAIALGDSSKVSVGDEVLAIGSPLGLANTVTQGIISAINRPVTAGTTDSTSYVNAIQTDAAINPGNSGGPLFNLKGEVVGINNRLISPVGANIGVGFAIPAEEAIPVVESLKKGVRPERGYLGISIRPVDEDTADALGLDKNRGEFVARVVAGEAADKAGLKEGDIVLRVNDRDVSPETTLSFIVANIKPGTRIPLDILREGKPMKLTATVGARPPEEKLAQSFNPEENKDFDKQTDTPDSKVVRDAVGISVIPLDAEIARALGLTTDIKGVVIDVPGTGTGAQVGLRRGDVIVSANYKPVSTAAGLADVVKEAKAAGRGAILLGVKRRGAPTQYVTVRLEK